MKTAMQEMIDYFKKQISEYPEDCQKGHIPRDVLNGMHHSNCNALAMAKKLLEKEKEQIIDAYYGKINGVFGYREEGQEYYNQTYNQNK